MKKLLVTLLVTLSVPALAVQEYYEIKRSIRAMGMGGAFYGLSDDEGALWYNPAGLARIRGGSRFNLIGIKADLVPSVISAIGTIQDQKGKDVQGIADALSKYQGKPLYGGIGVDFLSWTGKNFGLGIMLNDTKFNFSILGKDLDTSLEVTAISDSGVFAGYARSFLDDTLHIGVNAKAVVRAGGRRAFTVLDIANKDQFQIDPTKIGGVGAGFDMDLGGTYQVPMAQIGPWLQTHVSLVFNNLLASSLNVIHLSGGKPPGLVRTMSLGSHFVFVGWGPFDNFHALLDLSEFGLGGESNPDLGARGGSLWKHVNVGVEAPMNGWFVPRLGIHQGYLTAGFGVDARVLKLDVATYATELASGVGRLGSRRFAMRLSIGWGGAPAAPISGTKYDAPQDEKKEMTPTEQEAKKPETVTPVETPKDVPKADEPKPEVRKPQSEGEAVPASPEATTTTPTPVDGGDAVTIPKE